MPVLYNVVQRSEPGVTGGGHMKYYAIAVAAGEVSLEQLTTYIEKTSTVSGADIRAVLYSLVDIVPDLLAEGNIVRLGDLGSLHIGIGSEGYAKTSDVKPSSIKKSRILFKPGSRFKTMLKTLKFARA